MLKFPKLLTNQKEEIQPIDCIDDLQIIHDRIKLHYLDGCQSVVGIKYIKCRMINELSCYSSYNGELRRERCSRCYFSKGHFPRLNDKIKKLKIELIRRTNE